MTKHVPAEHILWEVTDVYDDKHDKLLQYTASLQCSCGYTVVIRNKVPFTTIVNFEDTGAAGMLYVCAKDGLELALEIHANDGARLNPTPEEHFDICATCGHTETQHSPDSLVCQLIGWTPGPRKCACMEFKRLAKSPQPDINPTQYPPYGYPGRAEAERTVPKMPPMDGLKSVQLRTPLAKLVWQNGDVRVFQSNEPAPFIVSNGGGWVNGNYDTLEEAIDAGQIKPGEKR